MPTVEGAGVPLAYEQAGAGPAVLLVHGMASGREAWAGAATALAQAARVIVYDRRGYGSSGAPEPYERTTVAEQAEDALALLEGLGAEPAAVACGVDLGALIVLDLLLRHPGAIRAAVLVDAFAFPLVPDANEALAAERAALEDALRDRGPAEAVRVWRALHGRPEGPGAARAFFADYGGQASLPLLRRELRALDVPVAILDGPGAPAHVRAAGDALAQLLPAARRGAAEDPATAVRELL